MVERWAPFLFSVYDRARRARTCMELGDLCTLPLLQFAFAHVGFATRSLCNLLQPATRIKNTVKAF
jgi:hypothetical protein